MNNISHYELYAGFHSRQQLKMKMKPEAKLLIGAESRD
jgi:hypothetical protein